MLTGSEYATYTRGVRHVPRNELLTALLHSIQKGILRISREVPAAGMLLKELANVR